MDSFCHKVGAQVELSNNQLPVVVKYTELSATAARLMIYSRDTSVKIQAATLRGPACRYSQTLPASYQFRPLVGTSSLRALQENAWGVTCPDPCYWSPGLPFIYTLQVTLQTTAESTVNTRQIKIPLALKRLAAKRQSLVWDGERTVLRGISLDPMTELEPLVPYLRETRASLITRAPNLAVLETCATQGIPLLWDCTRQPVSTEMLSWGEATRGIIGILLDWRQANELISRNVETPAALMLWADITNCEQPRELLTAWVPSPSPLPLRGIFYNLGSLPEQRSAESNSAQFKTAEGNCIEAKSTVMTELSRILVDAPCPVGVMATVDAAPADLASLRANCDRLQAATANLGDFAAYFCQAPPANPHHPSLLRGSNSA